MITNPAIFQELVSPSCWSLKDYHLHLYHQDNDENESHSLFIKFITREQADDKNFCSTLANQIKAWYDSINVEFPLDENSTIGYLLSLQAFKQIEASKKKSSNDLPPTDFTTPFD